MTHTFIHTKIHPLLISQGDFLINFHLNEKKQKKALKRQEFK